MTEADLDQQGVSKATGDARDRGYVMLEGRQITDVEGFYNQVGGRAGVTEHYMYSATNIRLRELSIGYSLPQAWLAKTGVIKNAQVSLVGATCSSSRTMLHMILMACFLPATVCKELMCLVCLQPFDWVQLES